MHVASNLQHVSCNMRSFHFPLILMGLTYHSKCHTCNDPCMNTLEAFLKVYSEHQTLMKHCHHLRSACKKYFKIVKKALGQTCPEVINWWNHWSDAHFCLTDNSWLSFLFVNLLCFYLSTVQKIIFIFFWQPRPGVQCITSITTQGLSNIWLQLSQLSLSFATTVR